MTVQLANGIAKGIYIEAIAESGNFLYVSRIDSDRYVQHLGNGINSTIANRVFSCLDTVIKSNKVALVLDTWCSWMLQAPKYDTEEQALLRLTFNDCYWQATKYVRELPKIK